MLATFALAAAVATADTSDVVAAGDAPPTYASEVATILHTKCAGCHRPGEAGPFSLLSADDAAEHAETIAAVVRDGYMPPWPPSPRGLPLRDDRSLSKEQTDALLNWADAGAPAGDLSQAPTPPEFVDGWALGKPDLILRMDETFEVPADGRDIYRWFALPLDLDKPLYVKAFEFRSTSNGAVHHSLLYVDRSKTARDRTANDGKAGFRGMRSEPEDMVGGFVPGMTPTPWPEGLAVTIPAHSDLYLQTHFHPNGREERERSVVGLYLTEEPPERPLHTVQLPPAFGRAGGIDIPAGDPAWTMTDELVLPTDVTVHGVSGHAHYLCKTMELVAEVPGEDPVTFLAIDDWDLDWQGDYKLTEPVRLPAGTKVTSTLVYDNSEANPDNPYSPPRRTVWVRQALTRWAPWTSSSRQTGNSPTADLERH